MDCPAGSVCRITKTKAFRFPADSNKIVEGLTSLFQLIWKAKSVRKAAIDLINSEDPLEEVNLVTSITPQFYHQALRSSKRNITFQEKENKAADVGEEEVLCQTMKVVVFHWRCSSHLG
jgi:hypothetical protein